MKSKKWVAILTSLMILVVMAGVSFAEDVSYAFIKPTEDVTITVWYAVSGKSGEAFNALLDAYQAENPNIHLEASYSGDYAETQAKLSANLATGTAPDVVLSSSLPLYTGGRGNFTMEALIQDPEFNVGDVYAGVWEYAKYAGHICAVPFSNSTPVLYYNKQIAAAAGLDIENNPPATWDELFEMGKTAQAKGNVNNSDAFWGFDTNDHTWVFNSMLGQNGNTLVAFEGDKIIPVFNNEQAQVAGNFWKKLVDEKVMPVGEHANAENAFLAGNVAFFAASSSRIPRYASSETVEVGALPLPAFETPRVALGGALLATFSTDPVKLAASWDLIKYLASVEHQSQYAIASGYLPIRASAMDQQIVKDAIAANPMFEVSYKQMANSWAYVWFDYESVMYQCVRRAVEAIEQGTDVKEALDTGVNELLREME